MTDDTSPPTDTDTGTEAELNRREFMAGAGAAASVVSLPFGVESLWLESAPLSSLAAANFGVFGNVSPHEETITHSDGRLAFHIPYSGDQTDIEEWVGQSESRDLLTVNEAIATATIVAPPGDVLSRGFSSPSLASESWLDTERDVDIRMEIRRPEPVDNLAESASIPVTRVTRLAMGLSSVDPLSHDKGVAFDQAPEGSIRAARQVTGAPDTLVDSAATRNVTVAVIDTGVNTAGGSVFGNTTVLDGSWNAITDETVAEAGLDAVGDGAGHGTHVASTIAADPGNGVMEEYTGYLPGCNLLVIKALSDDGSGSTDNIARAVTYAADQGADLLCMSLGSPKWSVELDRALSYAAGSDIVAFIAAGNNRTGTTWVSSPADADAATAIAAGTIQEPSKAEIAYFSQVGPDPGTQDFSNQVTAGESIDLAGTGMNLTALVADTAGDTSQKTLSGTSMATPCVVGAAGLVLAETAVSHEDLVTRLTDHAARVEKAGIHETGAGYPDVEAAINGEETDTSPEAARTTAAQDRDEAYKSLSDAEGRFIAQLL